MANMGKYCKAYPINRFREFAGWSENSQNARKVALPDENPEAEAPRQLTEADFLYLQEDYTVTDGIYIDENIIFDQVTPEWVAFCKSTLGFEVPTYQSAKAGAE